LTSSADLEKFFKDKLPPARTDAALKDAARAWLRLAWEFRQDGYYKFQLMDDSTKVANAPGGKVVSALAVVMSGGNGTLSVQLSFNETGALKTVTEKEAIRPGPRPRCQSTKLLDKDPIVRVMAEEALLSMGRAAREYLDEQRDKASPELKKAIDRIWQRICATDR
jgi:hypothetical protein